MAFPDLASVHWRGLRCDRAIIYWHGHGRLARPLGGSPALYATQTHPPRDKHLVTPADGTRLHVEVHGDATAPTVEQNPAQQKENQ
jgi:hypothetical protein